MDILRLAEKIGVEFAFPTRTLEIQGPEGPQFLSPQITAATDQTAGDVGRQAANEIDKER